ncbi:zinc-dependent peptidase [Uliginosibacterium sp. H1]|uniref:M90 family metallopeptidase n=1 Tax=Uliginosibacterium sp. H1 TaxID=3114757 RepID=UPI002E16FE9A|nr:M90 family metallopeptidase [Uliginosibacterium sp. H1]
MPIVVVSCLALLWVLWLASEPLRTAHRRRRIGRRPFPEAWRHILRNRVPWFRQLPVELQLRLKQHIQVFIAEKDFIGCAGQDIDDDVRVTIAAHACLLTLNRPAPFYPQLRQVLVYPGSFRVQRKRTEANGLVHEGEEVMSGESWSHGQVILSWHDTQEGAAVIDDGHNVALHEFAHQLDQEKGHANGAPLLGRRGNYAQWSAVLSREFARLREQTLAMGFDGEEPLIDPYGATDPAEFFAVATEAFFERPARLFGQAPELYRVLSGYYRLDPLGW